MPPTADDFLSSQSGATVEPNSAPPAIDHETAHVLFLDIVGFTKLLSLKQRFVLGKLKEIVRKTKDFRDAKKGELLALPTGDGMALVFLTSKGSSGKAVSCAEEITLAVLSHNKSTNDDDSKIHVRMGVHSGSVVQVLDVNERVNVAGEGINTTQRVMDCGDGGHILLSSVAYRLLPDEPDRRGQFKPLGIVRVKHDQEINLFSWCHEQIGNPQTPTRIEMEKKEGELRLEKLRRAIEKENEEKIATIKRLLEEEARKRRRKWIIGAGSVVMLLVMTFFIARAIQRPDPPPTLVVLPFQPQTQKKYSSRAISKGLTDQFIRSFRDLTNVEPRPLSSVSAVISQNSEAQGGSSQPLSPLEMGRRLNVRYVLRGTVESTNDDTNLTELSDVNPSFNVAIEAELWDTQVGKQIWKGSYVSKPFNELIELQKMITQEVAGKMNVPLRATVDSDNYTNVASANWYYLLGRFWSTRPEVPPGQDVVVKAIESYKKAIDIDPHFALAHAGLADMYSSYSGSSMDPKKAMDEAVKASGDAQTWGEKAGLPEVYCSIGTEKWWLERKFDIARIAFVLAINLNPQFADSRKRYSSFLAASGNHDEAERQAKKAIDLEPESAFMRFAAGQNYFFDNRKKYDKAIEQLKNALAIKPSLWDANRFLAMALEQKNMPQGALDELEKVPKDIREKDSDFLSAYAHVLPSLNRANEAREIAIKLERLKENREKGGGDYVSPYNIAVIYAAFSDERAQVLRWLNKALLESDPRLNWLRVDPRFKDWLDPRDKEFTQLLKEAGLPSEAEDRQTTGFVARR